MPQRSMSEEVFKSVLKRLPQSSSMVSLQGEGEPLLHPRIDSMAYRLQERGHTTHTITNLAYKLTDHMQRILNERFDHLGVSIDTLDADFSEQIGRTGLARVLKNLRHLCTVIDPRRITICSVYFGDEHVQAVAGLVAELGLRRHLVQPLQTKEEYARCYDGGPKGQQRPQGSQLGCHFLETKRMQYFTLDGLELPCCFIKDVRGFQGKESMRASLRQGVVPNVCRGCREICTLPLSETR